MSISEGDDSKKSLKDYIDGDIQPTVPMVIMKLHYTSIQTAPNISSGGIGASIPSGCFILPESMSLTNMFKAIVTESHI